jgi:hypothetical protein
MLLVNNPAVPRDLYSTLTCGLYSDVNIFCRPLNVQWTGLERKFRPTVWMTIKSKR